MEGALLSVHGSLKLLKLMLGSLGDPPFADSLVVGNGSRHRLGVKPPLMLKASLGIPLSIICAGPLMINGLGGRFRHLAHMMWRGVHCQHIQVSVLLQQILLVEGKGVTTLWRRRPVTGWR